MSVVVFSGNHRLDEWELRSALRRIPEVSRCLREAQVELDRQLNGGEDSVVCHDLMSAFIFENSDVMFDDAWRNLLVELVQLGLYRRYCRLNGTPSYVVAPQGDLGLLSWLSQGESLSSWLSKHVEKIKDKRHLKLVEMGEGLPVLAGRRLKEYECYHLTQGERAMTWESLPLAQMDLAQLVSHVVVESGDKEAVHVGSGDCSLTASQCEDLKSSGVNLSEFVEQDAMLHWFRQLQAS